MSETLKEAENALKLKLSDNPVDGSFKFDIEDTGVLRIVDGEVFSGDGEADVTIFATLETLRAIFEGELSPTAAYMTGKITVDGDMGEAMKLSQLLG